MKDRKHRVRRCWTLLTLAAISTVLLDVLLFDGQTTTTFLYGSTVLNQHAIRRDRNISQVIVSAYMNSGSTFTGRVLGYRPDAFYFYEPLWRLSLWGYFRNDSVCSTRTNTCKHVYASSINKNKPLPGHPKDDDQFLHDADVLSESNPDAIPVRALDHVINCRLQNVANFIQPGVTDSDQFTGPSWNDYRYCLQRKTSLNECVDQLTEKCRHQRHVVTKVIRLSVRHFRELLNKNKDLTVVHLLRDPRAIINSRLKTFGYPLDIRTIQSERHIRNNAEALCNKMQTDLTDGMMLEKQFPDRFRFVHYEDLFTNDDSMTRFHTFLGMTLTLRRLREIRSYFTKAGDAMNYEKREQRKRNNAFWWRDVLPWDTTKIVNAACDKVIQSLRYPSINDEAELRSFNTTRVLQSLAYLMT